MNPPDSAGCRTIVKQLADASLPGLARTRDLLGVTMAKTTLNGVPGYILTIPPAHANQVIYNIHGGGYVYGPGESGMAEAIPMAGIGGYKVIAADYRMPPDALYRPPWMTRWRAIKPCWP